jgi:hypothetical protein
MATEPRFFCPSCKAAIDKPPQYQLLGDVARAGGDFILMGSSDAFQCPSCGFQILKQDIVSGKLDSPPGAPAKIRLSGQEIAGMIFLLGIAAFIIVRCAL